MGSKKCDNTKQATVKEGMLFARFKTGRLIKRIANSLEVSFINNVNIPINITLHDSITMHDKQYRYEFCVSLVKLVLLTKGITKKYPEDSIMHDVNRRLFDRFRVRYGKHFRNNITRENIEWIAAVADDFLLGDYITDDSLKRWSMSQFSGFLDFEEDADKITFARHWKTYAEVFMPEVLDGIDYFSA